ncbi:hypothetical protein [Zhongshania sp. BJYM1]|uniref:hypothetical protein n=1 Tax=Zhongshania aquatica TaxID=2965069 RepID=UPI0022B53343|nr:hypothetical protein [Marortus sp. BJYM1]
MSHAKHSATQPNPIQLGQLLLAGGFITPAILQHALSKQQWSKCKLGDVLVQRHELNSIDKQAILRLQEKLAKHTPALKPDGSMTQALQLSLGQLLLESGEISPQQLDAALAEHSRQNRRLGEVLVEQQILTPIRLARWLQLQKKLISAAAVATWMMAGSCNAAADENQQNLWQKFISGKLTHEKTIQPQPAWGQVSATNLAKLNIRNRDLSELRRSRDGTVTLRFGEKGLNIMKRF